MQKNEKTKYVASLIVLTGWNNLLFTTFEWLRHDIYVGVSIKIQGISKLLGEY